MYKQKYQKYKQKYRSFKNNKITQVNNYQSIDHKNNLLLGGAFTKSDALKYIKSIGYEFEAGKLAPVLIDSKTKQVLPLNKYYVDGFNIINEDISIGIGETGTNEAMMETIQTCNISSDIRLMYDTPLMGAPSEMWNMNLFLSSNPLVSDLAKRVVIANNVNNITDYYDLQLRSTAINNNTDMTYVHTEFHLLYKIIDTANCSFDDIIKITLNNSIDKLSSHLSSGKLNKYTLAKQNNNNSNAIYNSVLENVPNVTLFNTNIELNNGYLGYLIPRAIDNIVQSVPWAIQMTFGCNLSDVIKVIIYLSNNHEATTKSFTSVVGGYDLSVLDTYKKILDLFVDYVITNNKTFNDKDIKNLEGWLFLVIYFVMKYKGNKASLYFASRHEYHEIATSISTELREEFILFAKTDAFPKIYSLISAFKILNNFIISALKADNPYDLTTTDDVAKLPYVNNIVLLEYRAFTFQINDLYMPEKQHSGSITLGQIKTNTL